jgi:hypothetical protein
MDASPLWEVREVKTLRVRKRVLAKMYPIRMMVRLENNMQTDAWSKAIEKARR